MTKKNNKIHFITLGCAKNRVDTEVMAGLIQRAHAVITTEIEEADVIIINTCSFIESAKKESIETILSAVKYKTEGKAKKLIVTGCLPQRYQEELARELPEVDHFLGTGNFTRITQLLDVTNIPNEQSRIKRTRFREPTYLYNSNTPRINSFLPWSAYLKVSEGCSRQCTFCIIPKIRGKSRSRDIEDITREAKRLVKSGVLELNLIAQDLTAYGRDLGDKSSLYLLLQKLEEIDGLRWIRLLYTYPINFDQKLLRLIANSEKVLHYIDLPLQHIDDEILLKMKRGTREKKTRELISRLRNEISPLTLRTTFIVGFPGETEKQFNKLLQFVEETEFDRLGVFTFSREEGTPAADMPNQVPQKIAKARMKELMRLQKKISNKKLKARIGTKVEVLVESPLDENGYVFVGRSSDQAPEVDGCSVIVDGRVKAGEIVRAEIINAYDYDLVVRKVTI